MMIEIKILPSLLRKAIAFSILLVLECKVFRILVKFHITNITLLKVVTSKNLIPMNVGFIFDNLFLTLILMLTYCI